MLDSVAVAVDFRFLQLDKLQAITLAREVQGASYCPAVSEHRFVGSVPLQERYLDDINHFFIRQKVLESECDILISSQQQASLYSVNVPAIVNRMLKDIDCAVTLSFGIG
ncbi:hypothetical protein [Paraglaciecola sp.]|uniref:hypothetical protein n=1 Tax=Paraglaciecola sp. TaxID=1920173 RepID=UPI0030F48AC8